jgi:UDPglucose 6-dehydrogenase|tara:strand:+ start:1791 stop:2972 length:1182 start_codon:yes stop_codon:yes gene_type:complete
MKIGFIGVGKLGKEAAEVMAEKHDVVGFDLSTVAPSNFKMVQTLGEACTDKEIIFVAVPTPHHPDYDGRYPTSHLPNKDFDYSIVKEVLEEIDKWTTKDQLVVLISTILPGTIRKELIPLCNNFRFIYNPYLIAMGTVKWDMINPEMIIIGTEDGTTTGDAKLLLEFYETFITEGTRYEIGTWDEAEAIKIFYNTFISTKVALVNMIQDVAEKGGNMNVDVVTQALERSTYRITGPAYMKAGMGDGGGCHPRDNIALRYMAEKLELGYDLFDAIMKAREEQAKNLSTRLVIESQRADLPIVILGQSYKPNVHYLDGSSSILTGKYCERFGSKFEVVYDPETPIKAVYLLGHMGKHHDYNFPEGSIVVDPWRSFKTDRNIKVIHYGNTRKKLED